jgi:hypothetical protein
MRRADGQSARMTAGLCRVGHWQHAVVVPLDVVDVVACKDKAAMRV